MGTIILRSWLVAAVAAVLMTACASASAAAVLDRFYVNGAQFPENLVQGPDGAIWFTTTHGLGRIGGDGRVRLYSTGKLDPGGLTVATDGALWFTDDHRVARMTAGGAMTVFSSGEVAFPQQIASGPDGTLWFTDPSDDLVARMTIDGHVTRITRLPDDTYPGPLVVAPDGSAWFVWDFGVGRVTPAGDSRLWTLTDTEVLTIADDGSIALGPDGNLWIAGMDYRDLIRFTPSGVATKIVAGSQPGQVIAGPDGNIWFTYYFGVGSVRVDGSRRATWPQPFGISSDCEQFSGSGPDGGLAFDAEGNLWAGDSSHRSLERLAFSPASASPLKPLLPRNRVLRSANAMSAGADGSVWISAKDTLVRVRVSGEQRVFHAGARGASGAILALRDGGAWFAAGGEIRRLLPDGRVRRFRRKHPRHSFVGGLALGPDGAVWFIDSEAGLVGRLSRDGRVHEFSRGFGRAPDLLTIAGDGRRYVWVSDQRGAIDRVSMSGKVERFTHGLSRRASPTAIAKGPDGSMWFTDFDHRRVGRITPRGAITEWLIADHPASIAQGADGAMWFTTSAADDIDNQAGVGRITATGQRSEFYARDTCSTPYSGLVSGPDGAIWFLESYGPIALARLDPAGLIATGQLPSG